MWNAWVLWVFLLFHASNFIMGTEDNSVKIIAWGASKLELFCQYEMTDILTLYCHEEMTSWHYIVTKSTIVDDLGVREPPLVCLFSVRIITKKIKI